MAGVTLPKALPDSEERTLKKSERVWKLFYMLKNYYILNEKNKLYLF